MGEISQKSVATLKKLSNKEIAIYNKCNNKILNNYLIVFDAMKKGSQVVKKSSNKKIAISTVQRSASAVGSQPVRYFIYLN